LANVNKITKRRSLSHVTRLIFGISPNISPTPIKIKSSNLGNSRKTRK